VQLTVNTNTVLGDEEPNLDNADELIRKLEKRISGYFNSKYTLDDFSLTGMCLVADIDVHSRKKAADYIKVLQRVGKVKGFSPVRENWLILQ
jgi:hypothetical protein